ncbi:MAG: iron-containing alcohol dehydrogenase [Acetobacteraceae bacterium]
MPDSPAQDRIAQDRIAQDRTDWNALIGDVVAGRWTDPETGRPARVPFETIVLAESIAGQEADLIAPLALGSRIAVVSDANTVEVMGRRVAHALSTIATVDEVVFPAGISCDEATIAEAGERTRHADGVVAVGSGVVNDVCKYATFRDKRRYAVFGTAASMNGYCSSTASVTLASGLKASLPAHAPRGIFLDLHVSAAAPSRLSAAGLGDSLCRPTAQVDWWVSHRLLGTSYSRTPYALQEVDEPAMLRSAAGLARGDLTSVGVLQRVLTLSSVGVCFTGTSHSGSMGEHQVSHWFDMFAGDAHPGSLHGHQVGVASLVLARLQHRILAMPEPPHVMPTRLDEADLRVRYGGLADLCLATARASALDAAGAEALNTRLATIWPDLKRETRPMLLPEETMRAALMAAGGPTTARELGTDVTIWREAVRHACEIRNRWSFLNLARDAGLLEAFIAEEVQ